MQNFFKVILLNLPIKKNRNPWIVSRTLRLFVAGATASLFGSAYPAHSVEYTTYCGMTITSMEICTVAKGDVVLNGQQYVSHTHNHPNGKRYTWLYPDGTSTAALCGIDSSIDTLFRIDDENWVPVTSYCQNDAFYLQSPSGDTALIIAM